VNPQLKEAAIELANAYEKLIISPIEADREAIQKEIDAIKARIDCIIRNERAKAEKAAV
jgi:tetrahydromethanopterin S-methyltransferase subunit F